MKRLVLQAIETTDGVTFWVSEQTHRGKEFGEVNFEFCASNGVRIRSDATPAWHPSIPTLFVRGSNTHKDMRVLHVDKSDEARIRTAVAEYNAAFADKPQAASASMPPILTIE